MITIILFIIVGLKLKVGVAYWCLLGILMGCRFIDLIFKIVLEQKRKKELDELLEEAKKLSNE